MQLLGKFAPLNNSKAATLLIFLTVLTTWQWQATHAEVLGLRRHYSKQRIVELREKVRGMFQHAYDGYLRYASNYDELRPLTCDGINTWGSYSLTLIDALDTLATMGNFTEFQRVALLLERKMDFDKDINVSVFETNIRIVGGLLSAHLLSKRAGLPLEVGWPCRGPLLRLADDVARRLLPAFDTATGMPYGTVNLRYGVPKGETPVTCVAGVGTFLVEFGTLSRLTGDPIFEEVAVNAVYALWERRSPIGLFGNHIDVQSGRWTALDSGIGAGVDSLFEYLVKGAILLQRPQLLRMFHEARSAIDKYLKRDDWYIWAGMNKGQVTLPVFQSLEAFWPGLLSIVGDTAPAMRTLVKYASVWRKYGFLPEFYNIPAGEASPNRESYPLRPELMESAMYLYRATKNQFLLELGEDMLQSMEFSAKTKCGYATIRNVVTHEKENRMESFFLAETTKYLYLLFDEDNFLHDDAGHGERLQTPNGECVVNAGAYIFNTEAHPVDMSALYCCHEIHEDIYDGLDVEQFRDEVLLKQERENRQAADAQNPKYECGADSSYATAAQSSSQKEAQSSTQKEKEQSSAATAKKDDDEEDAAAASLAVDIEVFDENNQPAAALLIESFERIKNERDANAGFERNGRPRNQLTVTDLDEFFSVRREQFKHSEHVLDYVIAFMRNYTLDAAFISGLQLFDKNLTAALGAAVQKEYEGRRRSLWELYALQQQYAVNAALVKQLGLMDFDDGKENRALLEDVLQALNHSANAPTADGETDDLPLRHLRERFNLSRLEFEMALVNTTAMQEFLLKILINGTTEKKRSFKPLLDENEITRKGSGPANKKEQNGGGATSTMRTADHKLFAYVRRIIEIKKRMIETFEKLQVLMQEAGSNSKQQDTASTTTDETPTSTTGAPDDDLIVEAASETKIVEPVRAVNENTSKERVRDPKSASNNASNEDDGSSDSVWSQLVQTILRKTTTQRIKFDVEQLQQKTRESLQKYSYVHAAEQAEESAVDSAGHEMFTCARPKFIEKLAYRDYYP